MMIEGLIDGQVLELYVERILVPQLRSGNIINLDNVAMHKITKVKILIVSTGTRIEPFACIFAGFESKKGVYF